MKREVQEKMEEAEEEIKYWKGQLKNWDGQISQLEKTLKHAAKKGKGPGTCVQCFNSEFGTCPIN